MKVNITAQVRMCLPDGWTISIKKEYNARSARTWFFVTITTSGSYDISKTDGDDLDDAIMRAFDKI